MNIGVLGTGMVGAAIATKLVAVGHDAMMGSRTAANDDPNAWSGRVGSQGRAGTFAEAAAFGEIVFNWHARGVIARVVVTDALGQVTPLSYAHPADRLKLTTMSDPSTIVSMNDC